MNAIIWKTGLAAMWSVAVSAAPVRVAVLDFYDASGAHAAPGLGAEFNREALADKGLFVLMQKLAEQEEMTVIDRREFIAAVEQSTPEATARPSFLRAAQALNAGAVIRGTIQGLSSGTMSVQQGGHAADLSMLTLRVGLEALDTLDGTVLAVVSGKAQMEVRQTENLRMTLGDEDFYEMLEKAVAEAVPQLQTALRTRQERQAARPRVRLNIRTTADPALVEMDGLLVGTTPMEGLEVTQGDHVLTVGKAGYRDLTKRIVFDRDMAIEVPMIRTELSADEIKDVLDKARTNIIIGEPGLTILPL
ncbi:MAG: PEGA domain-containing protein [Kiritimatiellae bacterium]|nr:PEGA domain-containing protein [Kiritimatiellia bacterium]